MTLQTPCIFNFIHGVYMSAEIVEKLLQGQLFTKDQHNRKCFISLNDHLVPVFMICM